MARLAIAALVALLLAATASASRRPSPSEAKAIRGAISGFVREPGSPAARDDRVVAVAVSTLDPRYAAARLSSPSAGASDLVLHRSLGTWWAVGFGSSLGCDSAPKQVLDDLRVGCSPPAATAWIFDCGPLVAAPRTLTLACGDGNYGLDRLVWHGFGTARATAGGVVRANDCTPNCAAGHFHSYRVTATADRLTVCGRARYYARLTIVYAGARPAGVARRDVHDLGC